MTSSDVMIESALKVRPGAAVISVPHAQVWQWALGMTLLTERLCDLLTVVSPDGARFMLSLAAKAAKKSPGRSHLIQDEKGSRIVLSQNELEYVQLFLLRTYRDGTADVNHVDLTADSKSGEFDVTWLFEVARMPLTAEEATSLLNEDD